jgi:hypothetical protein
MAVGTLRIMAGPDAETLADMIEQGVYDAHLARLRAALSRRASAVGSGAPARGGRVRVLGGPLAGRTGRVVDEAGAGFVVRLDATGDVYSLGALMLEAVPEEPR